MRLAVQQSDHFWADLQKQVDWYRDNASSEVAERYMGAVEAALQRVNAVLAEPPAVTRTRKPVRPAVESALPRESTLSLAALRAALGWSRALLASALNCSERALVNWEQFAFDAARVIMR